MPPIPRYWGVWVANARNCPKVRYANAIDFVEHHHQHLERIPIRAEPQLLILLVANISNCVLVRLVSSDLLVAKNSTGSKESLHRMHGEGNNYYLISLGPKAKER